MRKKDKIEFCITAVLIIVLLFALINGTRRIRRVRTRRALTRTRSTDLRKEPTAGETLTEKIAVGESQKADKALFKRLEDEAKKLVVRRDPFSRSTIKPIEASYSPMLLSGILWDEKNPSAIINGRIVGIGDKVDGNTVVSIKQDSVILNDGISDFILRLEL